MDHVSQTSAILMDGVTQMTQYTQLVYANLNNAKTMWHSKNNS